jgi:hypothetical protein
LKCLSQYVKVLFGFSKVLFEDISRCDPSICIKDLDSQSVCLSVRQTVSATDRQKIRPADRQTLTVTVSAIDRQIDR